MSDDSAIAGRGPAFLLIFAGLFAFTWSVVRACVQAITLDEADTYFWFVAKSDVFRPYPNNHILNTVLIWAMTHVFGTSSFIVRLPSLLGAAFYIFICYFLCRSVTDRFSIQFPLFICLIYNPFILDFMVAARGYGMADAFLLAAIAVPVWHHTKGGPSLQRSCRLASLALGLSFLANFSFGFVDLGAFLAIATWAVWRRGAESAVRILGWCILPGAFVVLLVSGNTLAHWKKDDLFLFEGAKSLGEMARSLVDASLYQPDPELGGSLFRILGLLKPLLLPALGILCAFQLVATSLDGSSQDARARWLRRLAGALAGIVALSVLLHYLAFRFDKIPLPMGRAGIFLLPLCTLFAGLVAAVPARSFIAQWLRRGIVATLFCLATYFMFCLRWSYFKEYEYGADVKGVYSVLMQLKDKYGVADVAAQGSFLSPLNFYRVASKRYDFPPFVSVVDDLPVSKPINVLEVTYNHAFMEREGLVVIYQGESTGVVIAVKPDGPIPPVRIDTDILLRRRKSARRR